MNGNDSEFVVSNRTRCQSGRALLVERHRAERCPNKVAPGSIYCAPHKAEAMQRVAMVTIPVAPTLDSALAEAGVRA